MEKKEKLDAEKQAAEIMDKFQRELKLIYASEKEKKEDQIFCHRSRLECLHEYCSMWIADLKVCAEVASCLSMVTSQAGKFEFMKQIIKRLDNLAAVISEKE